MCMPPEPASKWSLPRRRAAAPVSPSAQVPAAYSVFDFFTFILLFLLFLLYLQRKCISAKTTYILRSPERWDQLGKEADQDHSVGGRDHAVTIDVRGFLLLGRELGQIRQAAREQHCIGRCHQAVPR